MKKSLILPVIAAGFAITSASTVLGQQKSIGLTIRAGAAFPVDKYTRDFSNTVWPNVGVEYQIGTFGTKQVNPRETFGYSISVDVAGTNRCWDDGGYNRGNNGTIVNVPVLANLVYRTNGIVLSAGAGVAFNNNRNGWGNNRGNSWNNNRNNCVGFGYQGTIGYEFSGSTPIGVEARFLGNSKSWLNTINANVFVRF